ncbi:MAG: preprotein translocase subunit SecG [Verrucomicrobiota bacterium]|nr:preprotein translocase subunit SecG [Verrucomicrobiota bacterium]
MDILNFALTIILFLISLFLILLVLVQLPKKEAGLGTAFGGGTTDALFGAGAGNVLTQLTKYCTILFLVLCLVLARMNKLDSETNTASTNKGKSKKEQPAQPGNGLGGSPSDTTTEPSDTTTKSSDSTPEPTPTEGEPNKK